MMREVPTSYYYTYVRTTSDFGTEKKKKNQRSDHRSGGDGLRGRFVLCLTTCYNFCGAHTLGRGTSRRRTRNSDRTTRRRPLIIR